MADVIVLLNNDTIVQKNWISGLVETMQEYPECGVVQSKILFADGTTVNSVGVNEIEDFYFKDTGFGEKDSGQYEFIKEIEFFSGGSVAIRRQCLEQVGNFDEDFLMFLKTLITAYVVERKVGKFITLPRVLYTIDIMERPLPS